MPRLFFCLCAPASYALAADAPARAAAIVAVSVNS